MMYYYEDYFIHNQSPRYHNRPIVKHRVNVILDYVKNGQVARRKVENVKQQFGFSNAAFAHALASPKFKKEYRKLISPLLEQRKAEMRRSIRDKLKGVDVSVLRRGSK